MKENPYKRLPPLERKPDGTPYRMTPAQRKTGQRLKLCGLRRRVRPQIQPVEILLRLHRQSSQAAENRK